MNLFDLFKETKIPKTEFRVNKEEIQFIKATNPYTFYLEEKYVNCKVAVKKGDEVEVGQVIGKEEDDLSIPLLSSVKGKVLEIKDILNTNGEKVKAIVIEPVEDVDLCESEVNLSSLNTEEILAKLQEFSLSDVDGLPLSIKYRAFSGKSILVKAFSSEPNIVLYKILSKKEKEINKALEVLRTLFVDSEIKLASEINVASLIGKKPSNEIIELKREAFIKEYFAEEENIENVIIEDLQTLIYIGECFLSGKPHLEEYVLVSGRAIEENRLIKVKIGTSVEDIFVALNGNQEKLSKVIFGGVLRGRPQISTNVAIVNNTIAIAFLNDKNLGADVEFSCIRCAKCLRVCPEGLNPIKLMELLEIGEKEEFLKFGGKKCIECGLCSYVCPSKIEVANKIVTGKTFIK